MIAVLLAVAAMVCLGVGLRLLAVSGGADVLQGETSETRFVAGMAIIGGVVVFLLGTIALLAARRFALSPARRATAEGLELELIDIQAWGQELADIRDHLRQDPALVATHTTVEMREFEVPASWRPDGQYLVDQAGRPNDPLADLKRTRDYLMEAAERVDAIVKAIDDLAENSVTGRKSVSYGVQKPRWFRWWKSQ